ncbi:MAG: hypothetical protein RR967_02610 [Anaerovoracaceae bacterium]
MTTIQKRIKYGLRSKNNPWRNTRQDKEIPWNKILSAVFMIILPIVVVCLSTNAVLRMGSFYSFAFEKTGVVSEIPFSISHDSLVNTFSDFMVHKTGQFQLIEDTEYMPQKLFNEKDQWIMNTIRLILDILLLLTIALFIFATIIFVHMLKVSEKALIYDRAKKGVVIFSILAAINFIICIIPGSFPAIIRLLFGSEFIPGDVIIQILETKVPMYLGIWQLVSSIAIMTVIGYVIHSHASRRKMFRKVEE